VMEPGGCELTQWAYLSDRQNESQGVTWSS
jgi:hypothetical protein